MTTNTLRAHCGACASRMILHVQRDPVTRIESAFWYACQDPECSTLTDPRPTAAEAAEDVVWAPAARRNAPRGR